MARLESSGHESLLGDTTTMPAYLYVYNKCDMILRKVQGLARCFGWETAQIPAIGTPCNS